MKTSEFAALICYFVLVLSIGVYFFIKSLNRKTNAGSCVQNV